jgi:16S rRNA processing protein RimM
MDNDNRLIPLGRLRKAHGICGAIHAEFYGTDPQLLKNAEELYLLSPQKGAKPFLVKLLSLRYSAKGLILTFSSIDNRDEAIKLQGHSILVSRSSFPPLEEDEYYQTDLLGLDVLTEEGKIIGKINKFQDLGENSVLVIISSSGKETLIPWVADFIKEIDISQKKIIITPIPGLLDTNNNNNNNSSSNISNNNNKDNKATDNTNDQSEDR